jgi:hypothetical protein
VTLDEADGDEWRLHDDGVRGENDESGGFRAENDEAEQSDALAAVPDAPAMCVADATSPHNGTGRSESHELVRTAPTSDEEAS